MRLIGTVVATLCLLAESGLADTTWVSPGTVSNTTWTIAGSPYCVTGDISVANLTIEPGVTVEFFGNYGFDVGVNLQAVGTYADTIVFTKAHADSVQGWRGLRFLNVAPGSRMLFCKVDSTTDHSVDITASAPEIAHCRFTHNTVSGVQAGYMWVEADGGALLVDANMEISDCMIDSSTAIAGNGYGSAGAFGGGLITKGNLTLRNCTVEANNALAGASYGSGYGEGGGIYVRSGLLTMYNCIISHNFASGGGGPGGLSGGYGYGGGVEVRGKLGGRLTAVNCIFSGNHVEGFDSHIGGGIESDSGSTFLTNCVVAYNLNQGINVRSDTANLLNSIIYFNTAGQIGGNANVTYCDVQGGVPGQGNLDFNPVFLDTFFFRVVQNSPCQDAGQPDTLLDVCFPPSLGTNQNDLGAYGGPEACAWWPHIDCSSNSWVIDTMLPLQLCLPLPINGAYEVSGGNAAWTNDTLCFQADTIGTYTYDVIASRPGAVDTCRITCTLRSVTGTVDEKTEFPEKFTLRQNFPNPFNASTVIEFSLPSAGEVTLEIYNTSGQAVRHLFSGGISHGAKSVEWDGRDNLGRYVSSGIYFYRLSTTASVATRKMLLLK